MQAKKILLVQLGRIGDLILMTPMFKVLKEANTENELHLLAGQRNYFLAIEHPLIDRVHVFDKRLVNTVRLIQKLRKEKFDIWIDVKDHYSTESYFLAKLSNAEIKIGFNRDGKSLFDYGILSDVEQANRHAVDRNLAVLDLINVNFDHKNQKPILFVNDNSEKKLNNFLMLHDIQDYYCINISATSASRYWQTQKWIEFLNYLGESHIECLIITSPADAKLVNEIISSTKNAFHFSTDSIVDVFSVVKHSEMTITVDTAVVHIASAFDVPVLALYGNIPLNYNKYRPLSTHHQVAIAQSEKAPIAEISLDLMHEKFNELVKEIK